MMALPAVIKEPRASYGVTLEQSAALTVFIEGKAEPSSPPEGREQLLVDKPTSANPCCDRTWLVKATENVVIPPRSHQIITEKLDLEKGRTPPQTVCTKIYYRKTVGHVFTKPIKIEVTTQSPLP
jgi:hypothetical protein